MARLSRRAGGGLRAHRRRAAAATLFAAGLRPVPCGAYVVFSAELDGGVIGIVRVLHARQNAEVLRWSERGAVAVGASIHPYLLAF